MRGTISNPASLRLLELTKKETGKILVFTETKRSADILAYELSREGERTEALHGDRSQVSLPSSTRHDTTCHLSRCDVACVLTGAWGLRVMS